MLDVKVAPLCPELHDISPRFTIETGQDLDTSTALPQFATLPLPSSLGGTITFVGGPVLALDWNHTGEYLALAANRAAQPVHRVSETYVGDGHVQIWRAKPNNLELVGLAAHEGDTAWYLNWRPYTADATAITIAAALANGQLTLFHYPSHEPNPFDRFPVVTHLRKSGDLIDGVRVAKWSADGNRLACGTLKGCIEIWGVRKQEAGIAPSVVLETRVRVHTYTLSRIAWLNDFMIVTVGHDGAVRVRDIREPDVNLDNVDDGLAWNNCVIVCERECAIVGTDNGYLKFIKFSCYDVGRKAQLKRKRVQTGSVRDVVGITVASDSSKASASSTSEKTVLFCAGAEGVVFQGSLPRPLWTAPKSNPRNFACNSARYVQIPFLQWTTVASDENQSQNDGMVADVDKAEGESAIQDANSSSLPANQIAPPTSSDKLVFKNKDLYKIRAQPLLLRLWDTLWTKDTPRMLRASTKSRINVKSDVNLCADSYDQRLLIPRISLSENSRLLAVGSFAGFLTVIRVTDEVLNFSKPPNTAEGESTPNTKKRRVTKSPGRKQSTPKSSDKSETPTKRKRGRPRKKK